MNRVIWSNVLFVENDEKVIQIYVLHFQLLSYICFKLKSIDITHDGTKCFDIICYTIASCNCEAKEVQQQHYMQCCFKMSFIFIFLQIFSDSNFELQRWGSLDWEISGKLYVFSCSGKLLRYTNACDMTPVFQTVVCSLYWH